MKCPTCDMFLMELDGSWNWCKRCGTVVLNGEYTNVPQIVERARVMHGLLHEGVNKGGDWISAIMLADIGLSECVEPAKESELTRIPENNRVPTCPHCLSALHSVGYSNNVVVFECSGCGHNYTSTITKAEWIKGNPKLGQCVEPAKESELTRIPENNRVQRASDRGPGR